MDSMIIYGGSFDPVHNGHLRLARNASRALNSDVAFVPSKNPRWKQPEASIAQRLEMLRLALKSDGTPGFLVDTFEVDSKIEGINYTIDTVLHFKAKYPRRRLYLLIGGDSVNTFANWKDAEKIASLCTVVYVSRVGVEIDEEAVKRFKMQKLDYSGAGEVSSSAVRSLRSLDIPSSVREYIENKRLYYFKTISRFLGAKRLSHSVEVAKLALDIAKRNKVENPNGAYIAGILHDIGKDVGVERTHRIIRESYPEYEKYPDWTLHQFVGEYLAKTEFGIEDPEILKAIACHATGAPHMPPLSKIVYSADKIEPSRGYDSHTMISACLRNYYVGFMIVLHENRKFLFSKGYKVDNELTKQCFELYLGKE